MQLISKTEARSLGLSRYFTGKPCKYGHVAERYVSHGNCVVCSAVRYASDPRQRAYHSAFYKSEEQVARRRERYSGVEGWARYVVPNAKLRAKRADIPFNLTVEYVVSIATTHCPALGIPLSYGEGRGRVRADSASLDRKRPERGYVEGSIIVLSDRANRIRNNSTPEEMYAIAIRLSNGIPPPAQRPIEPRERRKNRALPRAERETQLALIATGRKRCLDCGEVLPLVAFYLSRGLGGRGVDCRACANARRAVADLHSWALRSAVKRRLAAKHDNAPCDVDAAYLESIAPEFCPYLGIRLNYGPGGANDPDRPSVDRIDSTKGYVRGNVEVISSRANTIKFNGTAAELAAVARYVMMET